MSKAKLQNTPCSGEIQLDLSQPITRPNILVMHASAGSGHMAAADAIARALRDDIASGYKAVPQQPDNVHVEVLDSFAFSENHIDGNKTVSGFVGPMRPIYDITWRFSFTGIILWNGGTQWMRMVFPKFLEWVKYNKPDAIVCTHISAANIAIGARLVTKIPFPIICVPTDYEVEGQFSVDYTTLWCAASEYMAETLRARRVKEDRIMITGIPVNPKFSVEYDKAESRAIWGFPDDRKVAIILAGAKLPKPYQRFRNTLFEFMPLMKQLPNVEFVFVAGADADYAAQLKEAIAKHGLTNARVLGYVTQMPQLMAASDFAICKAGGLTVTECLCTKTPMILVGKAYGQEKVNVRLFTSLGAAMHVQTSRELFETLKFVEHNDAGLQSLVYNGGILRHPEAAQTIARATLKLAYEPLTEEEKADRLKWHFWFDIGKPPAHAR